MLYFANIPNYITLIQLDNILLRLYHKFRLVNTLYLKCPPKSLVNTAVFWLKTSTLALSRAGLKGL